VLCTMRVIPVENPSPVIDRTTGQLFFLLSTWNLGEKGPFESEIIAQKSKETRAGYLC